MRFISDLVGTLNSWFRIRNTRLRDSNADSLDVRSSDDTEYRSLKVRDLKIHGPGDDEPGISLGLVNSPSSDIRYIIPEGGADDEVLAVDGTDGETVTLKWTSATTAENMIRVAVAEVTSGSSSTIPVVTPAGGATIRKVIVVVDQAFDGSPTLSVGTSTSTAQYMAANQNVLTLDTQFETQPLIEDDDPVIISFSSGAATQGTARVYVEYKLPDAAD